MPGYANPARLGDPFQSGRDIHPVAVDVVALDDDVAEVDADPEYDPLFLRGPGIALGHPPLHRDRTGDGLDHARELDQDAVAGRFDDAALVLGDLGIDQFTAMRPEPREGAGLIESHEAAISGHIGGENGREPALDPLSAQMLPPRRRLVENLSRPDCQRPLSLLPRWKPGNRAEPCRKAHQARRQSPNSSRSPIACSPDLLRSASSSSVIKRVEGRMRRDHSNGGYSPAPTKRGVNYFNSSRAPSFPSSGGY